MKIISFAKIKTNIYHCASVVKNKLSCRPKINLNLDYDRFNSTSYADKIMHYSNRGYNAFLSRQTLKNLPELNHFDYFRLSHEEVHAIRGMLPYDTAKNAELIVNNSKIIKQFLDNKYGKNKYVFTAADKTYSPVAKCLEYLGVESATKPTDDLAYHFKKVIFCSGQESEQEVKNLRKNFKSKNHIFMDLTETLRNNRDIKNNPKLKAVIDDFDSRRQQFRFMSYSDEKPLSELQKKFQFCLLDILNSQP